MGKHFKEEPIEMKAYVAPDEWYKARINTLERENLELTKEVEACEDKIEKLQGCIREYENAITVLEVNNEKLKAAYLEVKLGV